MTATTRILVVDDELDHAEAMEEVLTRVGYEVSLATSGEVAIRIVKDADFDLILTDLVMGEISGIDLLREARLSIPDIVVIVISGHGGVEAAVEAMQQGAATYLEKPLNIDAVRQVVAQQVEKQTLARRNVELEKRLDERFGFQGAEGGIIGKSPAMQRVFTVLTQVSGTNATVLITGESGTGKELVAKAIHQNSQRKHGPFVPLNCAALSEGVLESELFGHVKGAFTGAIKSRAGKFEFASGGTLFLDEVGDMPLAIQAKLLRVIEEREVTRLGANEAVKTDVRLLAATNKDLRAEVKKGNFREDLFFRLNVMTIPLPPLRERGADIPLLVNATLQDAVEEHGKPVEGITPEAQDALRAYDWPGNVRELKNAVESMVIVSRGAELTVDDLPAGIRESSGEIAPAASVTGATIADMERRLIEETLAEVEGNREQAATRLGISERTLYRKIKSYEDPSEG
ncbi:MAG: sigma-54 dependent transcriptional regulator [Planctomycetota bacterium]